MNAGKKKSLTVLFKNALTIFFYDIHIIFDEVKLGVWYRYKIYRTASALKSQSFFSRVKDGFDNSKWVITTILGVVGLFGLQPFLIYMNQVFNYPFLVQLIAKWNSLDPILVLSILGLTILGLIYFSIRNLSSKEELLKIATRYLGDNISPEERQIAQNPAANELKQIINIGRRREQTYQFLYDSWKEWIGDIPGLSIYPPVEGMSEPLPAVLVDIDLDRDFDPQHPEKQLNSIIKVDMKSIYKDFSDSALQDFYQREKEELYLRKPVCRYLTRYKGRKNPESSEFGNDYIGHNVCLRAMNFEDGKLVLPIESTLELYGNIMDSSDMLVNETYLHFAIDRYCSSVPTQYTLNFLPWRKALYEKYQNKAELLTRISGRAAGFGMSALTVYNYRGTYRVLRGVRTIDVGTLQDLYHVIPSGMTNVDISQEEINRKFLVPKGYLNVKLLIEKEFLEEVFSEDWARERNPNASVGLWPEKVQQHCVERLYGKAGMYRANIYLTGIVFDLLNLRPEICALILIRDEKWFTDHDPESKTKYPIKLSSLEWLQSAPSLCAEDAESVAKAMLPSQSVLAGSAAFQLGIKKFHELVKE
jgi:hypothetical protein